MQFCGNTSYFILTLKVEKTPVYMHLLAVPRVVVFPAFSHHQLAFYQILSCHGSSSIDDLEHPCIIKKYVVASAIVHHCTDHF